MVPNLVAFAWAVLFILCFCGGPPKGPSLQAVEERLELPFEFPAPAPASAYPHVRARDDCA